MMDTILVTGATGKLGSAVVEALAERGINVRAAARRTTKIRWTELVRPVVFDYEGPGPSQSCARQYIGRFSHCSAPGF